MARYQRYRATLRVLLPEPDPPLSGLLVAALTARWPHRTRLLHRRDCSLRGRSLFARHAPLGQWCGRSPRISPRRRFSSGRHNTRLVLRFGRCSTRKTHLDAPRRKHDLRSIHTRSRNRRARPGSEGVRQLSRLSFAHACGGWRMNIEREHGVRVQAFDGAAPFYLKSLQRPASRHEWYSAVISAKKPQEVSRTARSPVCRAFPCKLQVGASVTLVATTEANVCWMEKQQQPSAPIAK